MKTKINTLKIMGAICICGVGFLSGTAQAQQKISDVKVAVHDVVQVKDSINADIEITITGRAVPRRGQIRLYPVVRSAENEATFAPVVLNGNIKHKSNERKSRLNGYVDSTYTSIRSKGKTLDTKVRYQASIPAQAWMKDAYVGLVEETGNCRDEYARTSFEVIAAKIRKMDKPVFTTTFAPVIPFIQPPREEIKSRAASGEANIVYTVGNALIKPALGDNSMELAKIQRSIEEVKGLPGAQIKGMTISAYASPEGGWASNQTLSERRAASLLEWVRQSSNIAGIDYTARGYGEDWKRFGEMAEKDYTLTDNEKAFVMGLVNGNEDYDVRESKLRSYNGGRTYRYILSTIFPPLRRSEYKIDFTVPEYTLERSREIYKTHPYTLSLQELYALANEYEAGSPEFLKIIESAAKLFPEDKVARLNMAAANISSERFAIAREILKGMEDDPQAIIYLGIIAAQEGDMEGAENYLRKAQDVGTSGAEKLLHQFEEYRSEYDAYQSELGEWNSWGLE